MSNGPSKGLITFLALTLLAKLASPKNLDKISVKAIDIKQKILEPKPDPRSFREKYDEAYEYAYRHPIKAIPNLWRKVPKYEE